jgi:hypothetical protein
MSVAQILEQVQALSKPEREELISALKEQQLEEITVSFAQHWSGHTAMIYSTGAIPEPGEDLEELFRKANP